MKYNKRKCICGIEITTKFHKQHYKSKYHISKVGDRVNPWHQVGKINEDGKMYTTQALYEMSDKSQSLEFFENFYDKCSKDDAWIKKCRFCGISDDGGKIFGDDTTCRRCKTEQFKLQLANDPEKRAKLKKYYKDRREKRKQLYRSVNI